MNDLELMQAIHKQHHDAICAAVARSVISHAWIAATIANESGGDPTASRFEPNQYARLKGLNPDWPDERLRLNASSWGLTQIMGYHFNGDPRDLCKPDTSLTQSVILAESFVKRFNLLPFDHDKLFRCWNTGNPWGVTYDPAYVTNGLRRMIIWLELVNE